MVQLKHEKGFQKILWKMMKKYDTIISQSKALKLYNI